MTKTKCYSFYSYKGGSGRSTTAMNTVRHLIEELGASPTKPILMIDADLESAGLTFLFGLRNRISGELDLAMNTTLLLSTAGNDEREAAFGNGPGHNMMIKKLTDDVLKEIDKHMPEQRYAFEKMTMSFAEKSMLLSLLEQYDIYKSRGLNSGNKKKKAERVVMAFPPAVLAKKLCDIHKSCAGDEEKMNAEKRKALQDFLPLTTFADVSEYFGCEFGTVKFLGVDVNSDKTQVMSNEAMRPVEELLDTCNEKNCAAVIFDCGAGTQSSAHVLHSKSDVIVYCKRPTMQFALGTESNLIKYRECLESSMAEHEKKEGQKPVIILPTAVPKKAMENPLCAESFAALSRIVSNRALSGVIDSSFCSVEESLGEVELFKWREMILGTRPVDSAVSGLSDETRAELAKYQDRYNGKMPSDACEAYDTYARLAKKLVENS